MASVLAASIARRFYLDGRSKVEIAEEFGLSRYKVARILEDAREQRIVRFDIQLPGNLDAELSERLRVAWGLRRAIVIDAPGAGEDASLRHQLAVATADLLTELVVESDVLGITWSRTLEIAVGQLTELAPCTVVQLGGSLPTSGQDLTSVEIARKAAALGGGRAYPMHAPLVVTDRETAISLRRQPGIAEAFARFGDLTKAVIAVGAWTPNYSTVWHAVDATEREGYRELGACAEVSARLLTADGQELLTGLDDRVLAVTIDQLRAVPEVVGVVAGVVRAAAAAAALQAGFITTLVTDAAQAQRLLELAPPQPPGHGAVPTRKADFR